MNQIKVSVLMYVKNGMPYFKRAIQSVLEQTLQDIEVLVIDGGSTDGTLEIVEKLVREDNRVRLLHCDVGSVGAQFNLGLREARGEYIGIVESDDYLLPDMYEKQYELAEKHGVDMLRANAWHIFEIGDMEQRFIFSSIRDTNFLGKSVSRNNDVDFLKLGVSCFWSGIYQRKFLLNNNIYMNETTGASYQDIGFSFLTELYAEKVYFMADAFYCYRLDNDNSSSNNPQKLELINEEYRLLKENLKQRNIWDKYKENYLSWKLNSCLWFYNAVAEKEKEAYLTLFYQNMQKEIKNERYSCCELSLHQQELYKSLVKSLEVFATYVESIDSQQREAVSGIDTLDVSAEIFIFGAGNLGRVLNWYLTYTDRQVCAYLDNDVEKHGQYIDDILIRAPQEVVAYYPNASYIIASVEHGEEITKQLIQMGITKKHIIHCGNYEMLLKNILGR